MPRLPDDIAEEVQKAEAAKPSAGFTLIPRGKYVAKVMKFEEREEREVTKKDGGRFTAEESWNFMFGELYTPTGKRTPGALFYDLKLPGKKKAPADFSIPKWSKAKTKKEAWESIRESRIGKIKALFEAAGYEATSDAEELAEDEALVFVHVGHQGKGDDKKAMVLGVTPVPDHIDLDTLGDDEGDDDDDDF